jgi:hypothetical protein
MVLAGFVFKKCKCIPRFGTKIRGLAAGNRAGRATFIRKVPKLFLHPSPPLGELILKLFSLLLRLCASLAPVLGGKLIPPIGDWRRWRSNGRRMRCYIWLRKFNGGFSGSIIVVCRGRESRGGWRQNRRLVTIMAKVRTHKTAEAQSRGYCGRVRLLRSITSLFWGVFSVLCDRLQITQVRVSHFRKWAVVLVTGWGRRLGRSPGAERGVVIVHRVIIPRWIISLILSFAWA